MEEVEFEETEIEKMMEELKEKIKGAVKSRVVTTREGKTRPQSKWWDKECVRLKKEAIEALKEFRKGNRTKQELQEKKEEYKDICRNKKNRERKEELKKIRELKSESEVWEFIKKERKGKGDWRSKFHIDEWERHFMELLEGKREAEEGKKTEEKKARGGEEQVEITREEVERHVRMMKKKKAPGGDGMENEVWMYGTERVIGRMTEILNKVWRGEGFPAEWREGIICPIHKKGNKESIANYRGITLLNTGYKLYASILKERLMKEVEERGLLPDGQAGFRKGRGTMDNVYILDHLARREIRKKGGKMYALFVDLRAAFDRVDRGKMIECMREKGINGWMVDRVEEIYRVTKNKVRVGGTVSEGFETGKGVRQGCPLSPLLFVLFIADLDEKLRGAQEGGLVVGKEKIWSLAYADDIVCVARSEREMREMMKQLEKYVRKKKLEVNVEKTKVMIFGKGRKKVETPWMWEGRRIETVREFKYLGYVFNERGTEKAQVRELSRKGNKLIGCIWSIGERKFGNDEKVRMMMFDSMIGSILTYGAEIWGWKEQETIEKVQEKYLRWMLGVERETPGYIIREECKRNKMRVRAGKLAVKFEDKMGERGECKFLNECWKEKGRMADLQEREKYYQRGGFASVEVSRWRKEGRWMFGVLSERDKDVDKQERREEIGNGRYNRGYSEIVKERMPKYWERESEKERRLLARFRCGNEERENRYWMEEKDRMCRMCYEERETLEHMWRECKEMEEGVERRREEILHEDGREIGWMKKVVERREQIKRENERE